MIRPLTLLVLVLTSIGLGCGDDDRGTNSLPSDGLTQLTSGPEADMDFELSPDGARIVFRSNRGGAYDIWTISTHGTGLSRVTDTDEAEAYLTWAPSGDSLAFVKDLLAESTEIWIAPVDGGAGRPLASKPVNDRDPAWSPSGGRIAFQSQRSGNWDIWVVLTAGGEAIQLTDDPAFDIDPQWSPDGSTIAFVSTRSGSSDIWLVPAAGGIAVPLTDGPEGEYGPRWSCDGSRIAYMHSEGDMATDGDICVVELDGGAVVRLTNDDPWDLWPEWSPDGTQIAFVSRGRSPGDLDDLWLIPSSGGEPVPLTATPAASETRHRWTPDGLRIVFESCEEVNWDLWVLDLP